jgi:hypothetical protein
MLSTLRSCFLFLSLPLLAIWINKVVKRSSSHASDLKHPLSLGRQPSYLTKHTTPCALALGFYRQLRCCPFFLFYYINPVSALVPIIKNLTIKVCRHQKVSSVPLFHNTMLRSFSQLAFCQPERILLFG